MDNSLDLHILTTVSIFIIVQIVASVWWASRVNTILGIVQRELGDLVAELRAMKENYVNKAEFEKHSVPCKSQFDAIWKRIDQLHSKGE